MAGAYRQGAAFRFHGWVQRLLLPVSFRRRFGEQSRQAFAELYADARRVGTVSRARLLAREIAGMVGLAWRERLREETHGAPGILPAGWRPGRQGGGPVRFGSVGDDVRFAVRLLGKEPLYAVTAVVTLVIGLTVTGGAWTMVRGALLRPLPFRADDELVQIWSLTPPDRGRHHFTVSSADYLDMRERATSFVDIAAHNGFSAAITGPDGQAERRFGDVVTTNLFDVLGVAPELGTGFSSDNGVPGRDKVVLLDHDYWRARFAGDPSIVGRELMINEQMFTVLGVLPPGFSLPDPYHPLDRVPLYVPLTFDASDRQNHGSRYLKLVGRLRDGVSPAAASRELEAIAGSIAEAYPDTNEGFSAEAVPLREEFFGALRPLLLLVQGAALVVLVIALVNLSNLTLVRGKRRRGELAVRAALGAASGRLTRQMVTEGVVLAALGSAVAAILLLAGQEPLRAVASSYLPSITAVDVDAGVLAAVAGIGLVSGAFLGLLAAVDLGRGVERGLVQDAGRTAGRVSTRIRSGLVVAEIAFALALVLSAGLLTRSLLTLVRVPTGFDPEGVLMLEVSAPRDAYPGADGDRAYYEELTGRLAAIPGVEQVGAVSDPPFVSENRSRGINFAADPVPVADAPSVEYRTVSAGYFAALRIPLLSGRAFAATDGPDTPLVLVANESFAARYGSGVADTPGLRLIVSVGGEEPSSLEVIGVVGDERDDGFGAAMEPMLYYLADQLPVRRMTLLLRTGGDPGQLADAARAAVDATYPGVAIAGLQPMRRLLTASLADERLSVALSATSALLGLLLAGIGVYGVMGYQVASRTREIGVRTALGARPRQVVQEVLGESLTLTALGIVLGLAGGALTSHWLASLLFGIGPLDVPTYLGAPSVLAVVSLVASLVPARRAARVSPVTALRG